jgi:hypothetical protein
LATDETRRDDHVYVLEDAMNLGRIDLDRL